MQTLNESSDRGTREIADLFQPTTAMNSEISAAKKRLMDQWRQGRVPIGERSGCIQRRAAGEKIPLSSAQQQVWFFNQLQPQSALYNIPVALRLKGRLEVKIFHQAFSEVVKRHAILRTQFGLEKDTGLPFQCVKPFSAIPMEVVDLQSFPENQREGEMERLMQAEVRSSFDLKSDLMIRMKLFQLGQVDWGLTIVIHHIAADVWSWNIFCRDLAAFYSKLLEGEPVKLPELAIEYADFALWQQQWLTSSDYNDHLAYWKEKLVESPVTSALPLDYERPVTQKFRGASKVKSMPACLRACLLELGRSENATLFMTLFAGFQMLVHSYTGQEDLLIGSPSATRCRRELEGVIGFFANVLVFRTNLLGNPSFRQILQRTRNTVLQGLAHQEIPFTSLVQELQPQRSSRHLPFFQLLFMVQTRLARSFQLPGLAATDIDIDTGTAKFDLMFCVLDGMDDFSCCAEYNTDIFKPETITRLLDQYQELLESIVKNPEQHLSDLSCRTSHPYEYKPTESKLNLSHYES